MFVSGSRRRSFIAALTALERCRPDIARAVPPAPSPVLVPARTALANGCDALASAAHSLRAAVSAAGSARRVDHGTLAFARGRAQDGVRLVVDALAILARASGRSGPHEAARALPPAGIAVLLPAGMVTRLPRGSE